MSKNETIIVIALIIVILIAGNYILSYLRGLKVKEKEEKYSSENNYAGVSFHEGYKYKRVKSYKIYKVIFIIVMFLLLFYTYFEKQLSAVLWK